MITYSADVCCDGCQAMFGVGPFLRQVALEDAIDTRIMQRKWKHADLEQPDLEILCPDCAAKRLATRRAKRDGGGQ
jgi:DNA-directed RNA polymerase subunit RPC12/RpoP